MRLSIITINYNNAIGLEKTIRSIISQSFQNFEYIVIDGASTDMSVEVIKKYSDQINHWISEPDNGIYNAMNKGIKYACAEYLLFINSGDTLYNENVLQNIFTQNVKNDLVFGDLHRIFPDGHSDIVNSPDHIGIDHMLNDTLCHPVTLIRRVLFQKYGLYREDLHIVSDWAFFLKIIAFGNVTQQHIPVTITSFAMDGMSSLPENKGKIIDECQKVIKESFSPELLEICTDYGKYAQFYHKNIFTKIRKIKSIFRTIITVSGWKQVIYKKRVNWLIRTINEKVKQQLKDPLTIPVIIISYNRLTDLQKLVSFLLERKHKNIIIVDNQSTFPPLLEYYRSIENKVTVYHMDRNYGHLVFWKNRELYNRYADGYYVITDSDIIPNPALPNNYIRQLMQLLDKHKEVSKVGFALQIDDLPDYFKQKQSVINWEKQFWTDSVCKEIYRASLDTTFAIYPPYFDNLNFGTFYKALRVGGNFTAKHGGWYIDNERLSEEDIYYFKNANKSSSWKLDESGNFAGQNELYQ